MKYSLEQALNILANARTIDEINVNSSKISNYSIEQQLNIIANNLSNGGGEQKQIPLKPNYAWSDSKLTEELSKNLIDLFKLGSFTIVNDQSGFSNFMKNTSFSGGPYTLDLSNTNFDTVTTLHFYTLEYAFNGTKGINKIIFPDIAKDVTLSSCFHSNKDIREVENFPNNYNSIASCFNGCTLDKLILPIKYLDTPSSNVWFNTTTKIKDLTLKSNGNVFPYQVFQYVLSNMELERFVFDIAVDVTINFPESGTFGISLQNNKMPHENIVEFFNSLPQYTGPGTCTLYMANGIATNEITENDIGIATNKGYTVDTTTTS